MLPSPATDASPVSRLRFRQLERQSRAAITWRNDFAVFDGARSILQLLDGGRALVTTEVPIQELIGRAGTVAGGELVLRIRGRGQVGVELFVELPGPNGIERTYLDVTGAQLSDGGWSLPLLPMVIRAYPQRAAGCLMIELAAYGEAEVFGLEIGHARPGAAMAAEMLAFLDLEDAGRATLPRHADLANPGVFDRSAGEILLPEGSSTEIRTRSDLTRSYFTAVPASGDRLAVSIAGTGRVVLQARLRVPGPEGQQIVFQDSLTLHPEGARIALAAAARAALDSTFTTGSLDLKLTALEDTRVTDIRLEEAPAPSSAHVVLQNIVFPDPKICNEPELFVHVNDRAFLRMGVNTVLFLKGGVAAFDTYFNLLNLGNWVRNCRLDGLDLVLRGRGRFGLHVWMAAPEGSDTVIAHDDIIELTEAGVEVPLSALLLEKSLEAAKAGVVMFRLTALEDAEFIGGAYRTRAGDEAMPELAISVTTFRREKEVAETARRVSRFIDGYEHGDHVRLIIVDNGKSAQIDAHPRVSYFPNENLGGAGGFARGLTEATKMGATHCLFMDDDATFLTESFLRTYAYLRLARDSRTAVSGAMITNERKWAMWENGAYFHKFCHPQYVGFDLRHPPSVLHMEFGAGRAKPAQTYGGWWYFAFPIAHVQRYPFPFFVRGDDINFSLANKFNIATMNGVVSFQDDFFAKESALILYLDMRYHMVQHLCLPDMEVGANQVLTIPLRFLWRFLSRFHYESCEALLIAWQDVMRGPQFFAENADLAKRRAEIGGMIQQEKWKPADLRALPPVRTDSPNSPKRNRLLAATFNGTLLPFAKSRGARIAVPVELRSQMHPLWGAREITFFNPSTDQAYTVAMNRWKGLGIMWRTAMMALRFKLKYRSLVKTYQKAHPDIASPKFWDKKFAGEAVAPAAAKKP